MSSNEQETAKKEEQVQINALFIALDALEKEKRVMEGIVSRYSGITDTSRTREEIKKIYPDFQDSSLDAVKQHHEEKADAKQRLQNIAVERAKIIQNLQKLGVHIGENELWHKLTEELVHNSGSDNLHSKDTKKGNPIHIIKRKVCTLLERMQVGCPFKTAESSA